MYKSFFVLFACCVALSLGTDDLRCSTNEEVKCVNSCPPEKTCRNRDIQFSCIAVYTPCITKCVCKEGHYRNFLGTCITGEECDKCSKQNEFFSCGSACDNECSTIGKQNRTSCPIKNIVCNKQCYCDDGYARDSQGNCVPVDKC
ncbi:serine protease inhibitor swm-1-like isoform X2 [Anticarsia gemmatalis]|uniref:serine protease inhibitor swm-1-like isoform X2 n=1 Tax=Anticarsia gemmatalis TaxID=129554 RepID=UPI003F764E10